VVARRTEEELLADISMSVNHPRGLLWRVAFYCLMRFAIRGGRELYDVRRSDWVIDFDHKGEYVEYHERSSKNGKATFKRFQPEHFRLAVKVYDLDVVDSFKRYFKHLPEGPEAFFLSVIDTPQTVVWYSITVMGLKSLTTLVKRILSDNGLDPEDFSNKSGRTTLVTRMAEAGVPPEVGMDVTGRFDLN
jgi:hypothetical protein